MVDIVNEEQVEEFKTFEIFLKTIGPNTKGIQRYQ